MRWEAFSLAAALLVACAAEQRWVKPGMTGAGLAADHFECMRLVGMGQPAPSGAPPATLGQVMTQSQTSAAHARAERQRLYGQCMEAKGYRRR